MTLKAILAICLTFAILFPVIAKASPEEACPTVRVDTTHMLKESHQAASQRHEGANTNICFAFAAAELMSFELKEPVLPYHVALRNFMFSQSVEDYGAEKEGRPSQHISTQTGGRIRDSLLLSTSPTLNPTRELCSAKSLTKQSDWQAISSLIAFTSTGDPDSTACSDQNIKGLHKFELNLREIFSAVAPLPALEKIVTQICSERRVNVTSIREKIKSGQFAHERPPSEIKEALRLGKPVGIEFSTDMISPEMVYAHAAVFIGMEYDKSSKKCKFLLKDSYGKNCRENLNPGVQCDPKTGYYLVPEELADKHVKYANYFKK
jgi:hypothetical protein